MTPRIIPEIPLPVLLGDVIFTRWPSFMATVTVKVTGGLAAHQEQICEDGARPKTLTADRTLNRMSTWTWASRKDYFRRTRTEWCRWTPQTPFDAAQREVLEFYFQEAANSFNYSKVELLLQGVDALRNWIRRIPYDSEDAVRYRKLGDLVKSGVICSKIGNLGLIRVESLPEWAEYWNPSDSLNKLSSSSSWLLAEATDGFFPKDFARRELPKIDVEPPSEMTKLDPRVTEVLKANGIA